MEKIVLKEEKETLLIPLAGKALESKKENPILNDKKAIEIVDQIDYDFNSLKIPEKTNIMLCIRANLIDESLPENEINILDFDDCSYYWYVADIAFALRDLFEEKII